MDNTNNTSASPSSTRGIDVTHCYIAPPAQLVRENLHYAIVQVSKTRWTVVEFDGMVAGITTWKHPHKKMSWADACKLARDLTVKRLAETTGDNRERH